MATLSARQLQTSQWDYARHFRLVLEWLIAQDCGKTFQYGCHFASPQMIDELRARVAKPRKILKEMVEAKAEEKKPLKG